MFTIHQRIPTYNYSILFLFLYSRNMLQEVQWLCSPNYCSYLSKLPATNWDAGVYEYSPSASQDVTVWKASLFKTFFEVSSQTLFN